MTTPDFHLRPDHAVELGELLQFLDSWLASDKDRLGASLTCFVGSNAYNANRLRDDLNRFAFLLGATDSPSVLENEWRPNRLRHGRVSTTPTPTSDATCRAKW